MKILVTGASGLVGRALVPRLASAGHSIVRLTRAPARGPGELYWNPIAGTLDPGALEGVEAAVHLAGESLAAGRWTAERRRRILESRARGTRLLSETLARLTRAPRVLASASAVGYYGHRGDEILTEESASGGGFLAEVARGWEAGTGAAEACGIRVVRLRIGVVLTPLGGALARMLPAFRLGLGGPFGSGRQWMSWIALDDLLRAFEHALAQPALRGPVNAVAPDPVRNRDFAATLGRVLGRPARLPVPAFALRVLLGAMADEAVLGGQRVLPARLEAVGFAFRFPALEDALRHALGQGGPGTSHRP